MRPHSLYLTPLFVLSHHSNSEPLPWEPSCVTRDCLRAPAMTDWFDFTRAHCWIPCPQSCIMGRKWHTTKKREQVDPPPGMPCVIVSSATIRVYSECLLQSFHVIPISLRYTREKKKHISEQSAKGEPLAVRGCMYRMPQTYNLF